MELLNLSAQAFFADIYAEAKRAKPSPGHRALALIAKLGKLQRHYTLNIDGLAKAVGLTTYKADVMPDGAALQRSPLLKSMKGLGHASDSRRNVVAQGKRWRCMGTSTSWCVRPAAMSRTSRRQI